MDRELRRRVRIIQAIDDADLPAYKISRIAGFWFFPWGTFIKMRDEGIIIARKIPSDYGGTYFRYRLSAGSADKALDLLQAETVVAGGIA